MVASKSTELWSGTQEKVNVTKIVHFQARKDGIQQVHVCRVYIVDQLAIAAIQAKRVIHSACQRPGLRSLKTVIPEAKTIEVHICLQHANQLTKDKTSIQIVILIKVKDIKNQSPQDNNCGGVH
jgi:hypothetical protein